MTSVRSTIWRALAHGCQQQALPKGLDAAWDWLVGGIVQFVPRRRAFLRQAEQVDALAKQYAEAPDRKLREQAEEFRTLFRCRKETPERSTTGARPRWPPAKARR